MRKQQPKQQRETTSAVRPVILETDPDARSEALTLMVGILGQGPPGQYDRAADKAIEAQRAFDRSWRRVHGKGLERG